MAHTLFTTGYSGHDLASFLERLRENGINLVIDVRRNPVSRKKGFSKTRLAEFLKQNGVEYEHLRDLGVPERLRAELRSGDCDLTTYLKGFRLYLKEMTIALETVYNRVTRTRCCLLCVEQCSNECHRSVVAEEVAAWNGQTVRVRHL